MSSPWHPQTAPAVGFFVKLPVPEVLEVLASAGADFVVIDCEHGPVDLRAMSTMVGVARGLDLPVFVRVLGHSRSDLQPALDAGAAGLLVPHVDDAATAAHVVDICRFPPVGSRGGSTVTRAGNWGRSSAADYVSRGNTEVAIVAQIESLAAVEAVADIASVPGLDGVFIGPFDLALSSGLSPEDQDFLSMVERVEGACRSLMTGTVAATPARVVELFDRGYSFVIGGADTSLLASAAESMTAQVRILASSPRIP